MPGRSPSGRSVERLEGLAALGRASVGALRFWTPDALESRRAGETGPGPFVRSEGGAPGLRHLRLSDGDALLDLRFPILAPEIAGNGSGVYDVGDSTVLLHAPLSLSTGPGEPADLPALVVLGNARALWADGYPFVQALREVRERFGGGPLLWAPRVALPHRVALLFYLGVDLGDTTAARLEAVDGAYLDPVFGRLDGTAGRVERRCPCAGCRSGGAAGLEGHAIETFRGAVSEARAALAAGRLRELVESRLTAEPALAEMLRYADRELAPRLAARSPVVGTESRNYVLLESHRRPEMVRFRHRLLGRYRPPALKTVLLLVPCSKTKPYRHSRSHRRFRSAYEELRGAERVHVVSVSSPIGLVPRELEDVYPARHYDIPVTGEWQEGERAFVVDGVKHLLAAGEYRRIVVHLDPHEYAFLRPLLSDPARCRWTLSDDRTTSADAIAALRSALSDAVAGEAGVDGGPLSVVRQELREVAAVQFGRAAADRLFAPPLRLAGRPWAQRLTDGRTDLATLREERGLFQLTVPGAERLGELAPHWVEADAGVALTGDLFAPGVRRAETTIRVGDAVVVRRDGALVAVGEAMLPGPMMTEVGHGLAVRIRHRVRGSTDTALSPGETSSENGPVV